MLWKSFYDAKAYAFTLKNWRWKFALYFLLLCALFTLITSAPLASRINSALFSDPDFVAGQIPDGKISEGHFTMSAPSPHFVKLKSGQPFMAFSNDLLNSTETKGLFFSLEKDRITLYGGVSNENYFFLSKNEAEIAKFMENELGTDTAGGIPVNGEVFKKLLPLIKAGVYAVLPFFVFAMSATITLVMVFSISLPVFISSIMRLPSLGYFGALKIATLATTPAVLFFAAETALGYQSSGGFIYMILCFIIAWRIMRRLPPSMGQAG